MSLSQLLRRPLVGRAGEVVGRLSDVIVRLRGRDYPVVTGLVSEVGRREVFLPVEQVADFDGEHVQLTSEVVDLRPFERREGEVLLRADVLGHRVIDVADVELVRAHDLELRGRPDGWVVDGLDTAPHRPRLFGFFAGESQAQWRDWKSFEPLIGHAQSARVRGTFGRLGRLKPADIADLLEDANRTESREILQTVHADPELEADVFEELEPDSQTRLLRERSDAQIAAVLARMRADDAADAINDLPQNRRQPVLDALPAGQRTKVMTLMGFNPSSAGGLMALDILTAPPGSTVAEVLGRVSAARTLQPEALTSVHVVAEGNRLIGTATLVALLQADPDARLEQVMVTEPVRVLPDTDAEDVALLMTDYNLLTVPVVDHQDRILGVITVDDILETVIPEDWRRREPAPHPAHRTDQAAPNGPAQVTDIGG
ncbi:CBS domain-containing protein [Kitasatospora sp. MAP12-15]|uniref:magnesium transporter MgtE N-terminal domain-containing protein n=1 Tax=unclassified Kitasatospora TaxID=2633591 RepID=UPI0024741587|nr:CBS domain-containing protein [Kitasatospora sp. MAP12-44]MDH6108445.1 CBS domain-containing protein [Kitasatospora sp. MAP12-44]